MAAKTSSCMKGARLPLTRIPKLLAPFLLFAVTGILHTAVIMVYMNPLTAEMSRHLHEMEEHTADHWSAEYARLVQETKQDVTSLLIISIGVALVTLALAFAKQIVASCFGRTPAASTTDSGGDRYYSLVELLRDVSKWRNLKLPVIATAAIVIMSQLLSMALLGASFPTAIDDLGVLSVQGSVILVASRAFLDLGVMALINFAIWRNDKGWSVLVLAMLLLPTLLIPVCAFGLLHLCTKQVMGLGVSLLSVYDLLQGVQVQLYTAASSVYAYCYLPKATSKEENEPHAKCAPRRLAEALGFPTLAAAAPPATGERVGPLSFRLPLRR